MQYANTMNGSKMYLLSSSHLNSPWPSPNIKSTAAYATCCCNSNTAGDLSPTTLPYC